MAYLGLLLYFFCHYRSPWPLVLLLVALVAMAVRDRQKLIKTLAWLLVLGCLFTSCRWQMDRQAQQVPAQLTQVTILPDTIQVNGDRLAFRGQADGQTYQVFYRLTSQKEQTLFQTLTQPVLISGEINLEEPAGPGNFKGFDYKAYLFGQGIYSLGQLEGIDGLEPVSRKSPQLWLSQWRRQALVHLQQTFPAPMRHYMTGLLFGHLDKSFDEMTDLYSDLGIIHLFALSGMQVGFFLRYFRLSLLRLGLVDRTVDGWQLLFSLVYAGLTGWQVSVVRSLVQAFLGRFGVKGLDNLGLALLLTLVFWPTALLQTGGVLSFAYAFVLAFLQWEDGQGWQAMVKQSLVLALAVLPLLMWYFASYQPLSILLTLVLGLIFDSLLLPVLSLLFALSPLLPLTGVNQLFIWFEGLLTGLGSLIGRSWVFGSPSLLVLIMMLLGLGLLYDSWRQKAYRLVLMVAVVGLFVVTKHPLTNEVTMINVGQGDSIFLRDVRGKTVLIDVGGRPVFGQEEAWRQAVTTSNAERTVIPYLKSRGVGKIDHLVLTHTDTDHVGDLEEVVANFAIGEVLVSQGSLTDNSFVVRLQDLGVPVRVVTAGDSLPIMGSQLQVLYPWALGDGGNNDSLVLYGNLLGLNFLFTGDLEEGELELIDRYPHLPVDVLKAGHHGSKGSSYPEFLDHTGTKLALVSAGRKNRYQHPHQETLDRFDERGILVYRTDQVGAVRFRGLRQWQLETVND